MTNRQIQLARQALEFLATQEALVVDIIIHAAVNESAGEFVPLTDLNDTLELCDREGWIISERTRFKGCKRKITDEGRAVLKEMK